jgi:hypothetical protein
MAKSDRFVVIPRGAIVELYRAAAELREKYDEVNRHRIGLEAAFRRFEALIDNAAPGIVLESLTADDPPTPREVPKPRP